MDRTLSFEIDRSLDLDALASQFKARGRVHVASFLLATHAETLHRYLREEADWNLVLRGNEWSRVAGEDGMQVASTAVEQREAADIAYLSARTGSAYLYEEHRAEDNAEVRGSDPSVLARVADWFESDSMLQFFQRITGAPHLLRATVCARRWRSGHFGTLHHDLTIERHDSILRPRRVAFVLTLTPEWRPEWGGLLEFADSRGTIQEAYVPRFNALTLFSVEQLHAISYVAPFAKGERYTISGFLLGTPIQEDNFATVF